MGVGRRRGLIEPDHPRLSIVRQCPLVALGRSSFYHRPAGEGAENLALMRRIDEQFLETPWYGARQARARWRAISGGGATSSGASASDG
jgi:putative transposase